MLNMDVKHQVVIHTADMEWLDSPAQGVSRKPLERESAESGHVTSIVKYEPGSRFDQHSHPLGEEILVLEGVFSDEDGDYPAGTYIRNPPGSKHSPYSEQGCVLLVKLNQFSKFDKTSLRIDTRATPWQQGIGNLQVMPLHNFEEENIALVKWPAGERFKPHSHFGGEEILVLSGEFIDEFGRYPKYTWIRSPHMSQHFPYVEQETVIFVKTGHLLSRS
ncbi:cupin domain-containing protein [Vibrio superstes]|uniref:Cupin n=1 Tax=Vibrio superstes NBRC 103154 TaxID=1219062 RepID=A0A511QSI0_9VIBR|nr:cupin domain-containing protein [Vibrio superstes]GEM80303.1 cupin [Vibrio superstes NBRC 103154]